MAEVNMVSAITMALARALQDDERVVVFGEDVAKNGGVFRATDGLLERFGSNRVMDTPLAETVIAGMSIGMAAQGLRPVCEFQFMGFIYPALDQVINHASRLRNRTRGRLSCPLVFRAPMGAGIHAPEHHSESTETLFAHIPGLRVVIPSSPSRAYGLLLSAIADPDPVMFFEPTRLYRAQKEEVNDNGHGLPLDTCFVLREGRDITLVTWGPTVRETLAAAQTLAAEGISAEVIDVATISPIDFDTILASVEKTGKLVIIHEAPRNLGAGAEIAATIAERGLLSLHAPIERVTAPDTVVPLPRLEKAYMPSEKQIVDAARRVVSFS
jgi:2-oxoisovalerate dehydrogenase E1 component beta subunit